MIWKEGINLLPWDFVLPEKEKYLSKERQWYILAVKGEQFAIMNVYLAFESVGNRDWNDDLTSIMHKEIMQMQRDSYKIIVAGDLNAKIGNDFRNALKKNLPEVNYNGNLIRRLINTLGLKVANDKEEEGKLITRKCVDIDGKVWSQSTLDYFLTGRGVNVKSFKIMDDTETAISSDHHMIMMGLEGDEFIKRRSIKKPKPLYDLKKRNGNTEKLYSDTVDAKLSLLSIKEFMELPQKLKIEILEEAMLSGAKRAFPTTTRGKKHIRLGKTLMKKIRRKMSLWKKIRGQSATRDDIKEHTKLRREISREKLLEACKRRTKKATMLAQEDPTMEKFWGIYRARNDKDMGIQAMKGVDGKIATRPGDMGKIVYEAFKKRLDGSETPIQISSFDNDNDSLEKEMMGWVSNGELKTVISSFKNGRAGGPHFLRAELLKMLTKKSREYLRAWINEVFRKGKMDPCLNEGLVKLIYKRGSKLDPLSYRPITLSCILGKLVTRWVLSGNINNLDIRGITRNRVAIFAVRKGQPKTININK